MTATLYTLKLEADGAPIADLINEGLRIAKMMNVTVETEFNGADVLIHPLNTFDEVLEQYKINKA